MDQTTFFFWVLAGLTGLCAIAVVVTQNIVRSAAYLLFTLAGTGGIFFLLGADFVGATQIIVYIGGILVLVVFGVMLTAQGPFITMKTGAAEWAVATVVGLLLYSVIAVSTLLANWPWLTGTVLENDPAASRTSVDLGIGFLTTYLLPFEIVSVHLLVVLIGAAYLARAKRRRGARS